MKSIKKSPSVASLFIFLGVLIMSFKCSAQITLYGMSQEGGIRGTGTIFKFTPNTGKDSVISTLGSRGEAQLPEGTLTYDPNNGMYYGMTYLGGKYNAGTIIMFNPTTNIDTVLWSFGSGTSDGSAPSGSFLFHSQNGLLYGLISAGGKYNNGVIISFNPSTNIEDTLYSFKNGGDGSSPEGDLIYDAGKGLFYGLTENGGITNDGSIFSFDTATNTETTVHSFSSGADGFEPSGNLAYNPGNGLYYGVTNGGGANYSGCVFSFDVSTNVEAVVHSFKYTELTGPTGNLAYDATTSLFYGLASNGGAHYVGGVYSFNPATNSEAVVYSFGSYTGDAEEAQFSSSLIYDAGTSLFYGMTTGGGIYGAGAVFSFNPSTNAEDTVYSFGNGIDGARPKQSLTYNASSGLLYGMTYGGGTAGDGTIISINPTTRAENVLWSFDGAHDGINPYGELVYDATNASFYGMTYYGGTFGYGAIVSLNRLTNAEDTAYNFKGGVYGSNSQGNLVYDSANGFFYGMVYYGGIHNEGAIIRFDATSNTLDTVYSFQNGTADGHNPIASLVYDGVNQLLYGMIPYGGTHGTGIIFTFNPTSNKETVVWNFGSGTDGSNPDGNLYYNTADGLFYGTTASGGTNFQGVIFSFNPTNLAEAVVWNFGSGTDGASPNGNLVYNPGNGIIPSNGLIYGMTSAGGVNGEGIIFSFNTTSHVEADVWDFGLGTDGVSPNGSLTYNPGDTLFFGMTANGGEYNNGVIFTFNPLTAHENVVWNFAGDTDASQPHGSLLLYRPAPTISVHTSINSETTECSNVGSATVSVTGGVSPFTYLWTTGSTTTNATALSAGTYTIIVDDNNGYSASATAVITTPAALVAHASIIAEATECANIGIAGAAPTGGTSPYTYLWTGGSTNSNATSLSAGTYTVAIHDNSGCSVTSAVAITTPAALAANASVLSESGECTNTGIAGAAPTGGTSPYTYLWTGGSTNSSATALSVGTYTITIHDNTGCSVTSAIAITAPTAVTAGANVIQNATACVHAGVASVVPANGLYPYTYSWTNGSTNSFAADLSAGGYTVTVHDNYGCSATSSVNITAPTAFTAIPSVNNNVACNGGSNGQATVSLNGGTSPYTYLWSDGGSQTTAVASGLSAGDYTIIMQDNSGCIITHNVSITQPAVLISNAITTAEATECANAGIASAAPTGGTSPYTYLWTGGSTNSNATALAASTYTVIVHDNLGCSVTSAVTVTTPAALAANASAIAESGECANAGIAGAAPTGGTSPYTYLWTGGSTNPSATALSAGTYTITISDNSGCSVTSAVVITAPTAITANANIIQNATACANIGIVTVTPVDGLYPYTYSWTNGSTNSFVSDLSAGGYTVTIQDNNGCSATSAINITAPAALTATPSIDNNVSCNGGSNGQATVSLNGGTSPYTYQWSDGSSQTTAVAAGLSAGIYTVIIQDNSGCIVTSSVSVTQPAVISIRKDSTSDNGTCNGRATATVSGGTEPYTYAWSPGGGTNDTIAGKCTGMYKCVVTDSHGCMDSTVINIISTTGINTITNNSSSISIYPNPSTGLFTLVGANAGQTLEIYNCLGQKISSYILHNSTQQLNMTEQANGIYLIRILNKDGTLMDEKKMVKTN